VDQASPKHRSDVVDLQLHPFEPPRKLIPDWLLCSSLTPGDVEVGASQFDNVLLAGLPELEAGVLAHRLVQPIAGAALGVLSHDQGLVDKR
jgi:hypothetical protein